MPARSFPEPFAAWQAAPGFSFSAAAGALPGVVANEVAAACRPGPASILSLPFTTAAFRCLQAETEACLRRLLAIPEAFAVLFMGGGASAQFALLPMNLLGHREDAADADDSAGGSGAAGRALYIDSGYWSRRALAEAQRYGDVRVLALAADDVRCADPESRADGSAIDCRRFAYAHFTSNETADGVQFHALPELDLALAADMTSDFLTRPLDWSRLGVVYAGTQKTIGTPGLTVIVVRRDLLGHARADTPRMMNYAEQAAADSRLCTPPVLPIFVAHRMLHWIEDAGGVAAMASRLEQRSAAVHGAIDDANAGAGGFYTRRVAPAWRSQVNPCFDLPDPTCCEDFIAAADAAGLRDLRGHPQRGGIRVSLYHGLPDAAVEALVAFIGDFARRGRRTGSTPGRVHKP